MFELAAPINASKADLYPDLAAQLEALLAGERDFIANAANMAALLFHTLPKVNWVGFYLLKSGELVLGPFQGKPACVRIQVDQGVCGKAMARGESIVVADVHQFPGYIVCDSASRSEIVVPLLTGRDAWGVLDLDSPALNRFDDEDRQGCEKLVSILMAACDPP